MQKRKQRRKRQISVLPPVVVSPDVLPLLDSQVTWNGFEKFIRQLIGLLPRVRQVKRYGKLGSKQKGIDLIAIMENDERWVFQCKQYSSFKLKDAEESVAKATYQADKYFLIIACQADSTLHDFIEKQKKWELWDGERLSDEVLKLPRDKARELVIRHFGPDWSKTFLGLGSTSPFLPWKLFFQRWSRPDRLFNHTWHLVGRNNYISVLGGFCSDKHKRVALLIGRGGIGKSKLLHAFAQHYSAKCSNRQLWFVEENIPLTQSSIDELPNSPCVIVVDDAHRSESLKSLFAATVHSGGQKKLLLSTRPQRLDFLKSELTLAGFDCREIEQLPELKHLSRDEVKTLARHALGPKLAYLDRRLANATWDCPLVTVVGGKLLATESLAPELLESHQAFRAEVLNRFQDIIVGRIAEGKDARYFCELLGVLSATAPFPAENQEFIKITAKFLKRSPEDVIKGISELEQTGVLLRRGRLSRITPDVLADHILHRACVMPNGQRTGFAERIFFDFANIHPEKVFLNLAELDWRILVAAKRSTLLETIWKNLENDFCTGSAELKSRVMNLVKEVAYYQPKRALWMTELSLKHLPPPPKEKPGLFVMSWRKNIALMLPDILHRVAFTLEFVPTVARRLWELGRDDTRQLNQYPNHAFRILTELAAYGRDKPLSFYETILDTIIPWLKEPDIHSYKHSLLDVLDKFLAKVGEWTESEGMQFSWGRFPVSREKTAHLREKAFKAICSCAMADSQVVTLRVLKSIQKMLHSGLEYDLGHVTSKDIRQWQPDQLEAIAAVERIVRQTSDPIILHRCLDVLRDRPRSEHSKKVRREADTVSGLVRDSFELRLVRALVRSDDQSWRKRHADFNVAHELHEDEIQKFHGKISSEFQKKYPLAKMGIKVLGDLIHHLGAGDIAVYEMPFLSEFAAHDMVYTRTVCSAIVTKPASELSRVFHNFLNAVEGVQPEGALPYAQSAVASHNVMLCFSVASHLAWVARRRSLSKGEIILLSKVLRSSDVSVASNALSGVRSIGNKNPNEGIRLLLSVKWGRNTHLAAAALSCIDQQHGIPPDRISIAQVRHILKRLETLPHIESYEFGGFLGYASLCCPNDVVKLFVNRIERSLRQKFGFDRRPIPHEFNYSPPDLSKTKCGVASLRGIRNMTLKKQWQYRHFGRDLFWALAPFDFCLSILNEWVDSLDNTRFDAALLLLQEVESDFVFSKPECVELILTKAEKHSAERLGSAKSALLFCATRHGESRAVGQPGPATLATKGRAAELAKKHPLGSMMAEFYQSIVNRSEARLAHERLDDEERSEDE